MSFAAFGLRDCGGVLCLASVAPRAPTRHSATTASPRWPAMSSSSPPKVTCGRRRSAAACPSGSPRIPGRRPTRRCRPTASGSRSPAPTKDRRSVRTAARRWSAEAAHLGRRSRHLRVVDARRQGALRNAALLHAAEHRADCHRSGHQRSDGGAAGAGQRRHLRRRRARCSSRACRSRAATPSATRAAPRRTSGAFAGGDRGRAADRRLRGHEQDGR